MMKLVNLENGELVEDGIENVGDVQFFIHVPYTIQARGDSETYLIEIKQADNRIVQLVLIDESELL